MTRGGGLSCWRDFLRRRSGGLSVDRRRLRRAFVGRRNFGGVGSRKIRYPRHAAPRQAVSIEMPPVLLVAGPGRGDGIFSAGKPLFERGGKERQHADQPCARDETRRRSQTAGSNTRPVSFDRKPRPPCCAKTTPLWRDYVRLGDLIPVELAAVLNGGLRPLSI